MNDPHVASLQYRVIKSDNYIFQDPPDIDINTNDFNGCLSNGVLTLKPKEHYHSDELIRQIAEKFIRTWEMATSLRYGNREFRFEFVGSDIVDRNPPNGKQPAHVDGTMHLTGSTEAIPIYKKYPIPPEDFNITSEVKVLWDRYYDYVEGSDKLPGMAYSCLSFLENGLGRKKAAIHFRIQFEVLDTLGELSAMRGDNATARKFTTKTKPLSHYENVWIQSTIKAIIKHLATRKPNQILRMDDLPDLE